MEKLQILLILLMFSLITSCSSTQYRVNSSPSEAEVEARYKSGAVKSVGKTPLTIAANDINANRESFSLVVKKNGYSDAEVFVPESSFNKSIELNVSLKKQEGSSEAFQQQKVVSEVAAAVADIQKDIQTKNFDIAINKLNKMMVDYPTVSTFYSLQGNVHYLERRTDKALAAYKRALELNPGSVELQKIIEKLNSVSGESR